MDLVVHDDPESFLVAAAVAAAGRSADLSMVQTWARGFARDRSAGQDALRYLATIIGASGRGVAMQRDDSPAVIGDSDEVAAEAFAEDLARRLPDLTGVVGSPSACDAFAKVFEKRTGQVRHQRVRMRHHVLTEIAIVPEMPGRMRLADASEDGWLIAQQLAFVEEVRLTDRPERVRAEAPRRRARGEFRIWDDGAAVAFAGFGDAGPEAARIAPVYTLPAHRGRGYATALVAALARELLDAGRRELFLLTDVANPTSNAIYVRIGFRPLHEIVAFDFVAPEAGAPR